MVNFFANPEDDASEADTEVGYELMTMLGFSLTEDLLRKYSNPWGMDGESYNIVAVYNNYYDIMSKERFIDMFKFIAFR